MVRRQPRQAMTGGYDEALVARSDDKAAAITYSDHRFGPFGLRCRAHKYRVPCSRSALICAYLLIRRGSGLFRISELAPASWIGSALRSGAGLRGREPRVVFAGAAGFEEPLEPQRHLISRSTLRVFRSEAAAQWRIATTAA